MSRNIKEIGKELMGKSLNSYHRKTGLTQLEKNNEMQDGILNGILSQVDDAYIEKTEQSNVIHLDGSGDGVVVLDSIEGNTMVNLWDNNIKWNLYTDNGNVGVNTHNFQSELSTKLKPNTTYTYVVLGATENIDLTGAYLGSSFIVSSGINVSSPTLVTTTSNFNSSVHITPHLYPKSGTLLTESDIQNLKILFIEGDHRDKSLNWFEGLQSSFEEKVNEDGKYEIEILMKNKNLINIPTHKDNNNGGLFSEKWTTSLDKPIYLDESKRYYFKAKFIGKNLVQREGAPAMHITIRFEVVNSDGSITDKFNCMTNGINGVATSNVEMYMQKSFENVKQINSIHVLATRFTGEIEFKDFQLREGLIDDYIEPKQNKIKLLINEPLRAIGDVKDKLCVKDNRLIVERNCGSDVLNGEEGWNGMSYGGLTSETRPNTLYFYKYIDNLLGDMPILSDKFANVSSIYSKDIEGIHTIDHSLNNLRISINKSKLLSESVTGFKQWLSENFISIIYQLTEPYYEEVTNEYGEPIIMEGYENGTLYIDSTIIPTTTVRYTPKMESFKTIKEVKDNNIMLTSDINDTIIPYMMEVDLMIMEKEMSLFNSLNKNIRKIGAEDMTSMQKRTGEMLERLIKGKSLNEQECKTRVTVYLNASKITDEQAEELMLLISEIYA